MKFIHVYKCYVYDLVERAFYLVHILLNKVKDSTLNNVLAKIYAHLFLLQPTTQALMQHLHVKSRCRIVENPLFLKAAVL